MAPALATDGGSGPVSPPPPTDLIARGLDAIQRVGFPVVVTILLMWAFYREIQEQRHEMVLRLESRLERIERTCAPYPFPAPLPPSLPPAMPR